MITISNLNLTYSDSENPALKRLNLQVQDGEFMLLTGPTGSGKTSLLLAIAGLAPSFTGGKASGSIEIDGKQRLGATAQSLSADVAFVNQQPESSFVAETVIDELAFGLEQFGVEPSKIRELVAQIAKLLDIERLLNRQTAELSGGEQQKVAIAAALAGNKKILLLDEPTSALDSASAEAVISTLKDLNQKHGYTVIVSEHRFDHLRGVVDSVATVQSDGTLRKAMAGTNEFALATSSEFDLTNKSSRVGEKVVAILGANGSGKSTLLWKLQAELGAVLVPQRASDLLYLQSVAAEFKESDAASSKHLGATGSLFESLIGRVDPKIHPRDLSAGQQLALALSVQLVRDESVILLDEPTRGLDMKAKNQLALQLRKLQASGKKIVVATHDREFATAVADELIGISKGVLDSHLLIGDKTFTGTGEVRAQA